MSKARTGADFASKHDPKTVIGNLSRELKTAKEAELTAAAVRDFLGTAKLETEVLNVPAWVYKPKVTADAPGVPTLMLSDLHWGERVFKAQVGGVNEYNLAIATQRLKNVIAAVPHLLHILDKDMRYPGIVVQLGGDMVGGNIHEELAATNEEGIMPTWLHLFENLVAALKMTADVFGNVFIPCVSGNHDRDTKKTWAKNRNATSFGWLLYQMLANHFKDDKRFTFYIPDAADALYKTYNTRYLLTHGDQFKGGDGIIGPIGPLARGNQKKQQRNTAVDQSYDIMVAGHWHQRITLSNLMVNNSLKGYDEYAFANNFRFSKPSQNLWTTHADYGVNWEMEVFADRIKASQIEVPWVSVPKLG